MKRTKGNKVSQQQNPIPQIPAGDYDVRVVDASIMRAQNGDIGLIWVLQVYSPRKYEGRNLAKATPIDPRFPATMLVAAAEFGRCGLTTEQSYHGDVPALLKGRELRIHYTPATGEAGAEDEEEIEILGQVEAETSRQPTS